MLLKLTPLFVVLLLLSGCSTVEVTTKYKSDFPFNDVNLYSLYGRNSSQSNYQNLSDGLRNQIELAVERGLDSKGYQYQDILPNDDQANKVEKPKLLVAYYIIGRNRNNLIKYSQGVRYCDYCLSKTAAEKKLKVDLSPGNLLIDLVDSQSMRSVWRSSAALDLDKDDNTGLRQEKLTELIHQMFLSLPEHSL